MPNSTQKLSAHGVYTIPAGQRITLDPELRGADGSILRPNDVIASQGAKWVSTQEDGTFDIQNFSQEELDCNWLAVYVHSINYNHEQTEQTGLGANGQSPSVRAAINFAQPPPDPTPVPPGSFWSDDDAALFEGMWDMNGFNGSGNVTNRGTLGSAADLLPYPVPANDVQFEMDSSFVAGAKCIMTRTSGLYLPGPNALYTKGDFSAIFSFNETPYNPTAYTPIFAWRPSLIGAAPLRLFTKYGINGEFFIDNASAAAYSRILSMRRGKKEVWGIICESNVYKIFLNGSLIHTTPALTAPAAGDQTFYLAGVYNANNYYRGEIGPGCLGHSVISDEKMISMQKQLLGLTA